MDDFSKYLIMGIVWALILPVAVPYVIILLAPVLGVVGAIAAAAVLLLLPAWISDPAQRKSDSNSPKASPQVSPEPKQEIRLANEGRPLEAPPESAQKKAS